MSDLTKRVATRGVDGVVRVTFGRALGEIPRLSVLLWSGSQPPANQAPTVSITAPTAATSITAGQAVNLSASATDSDGTVTRVRYFIDGTQVAQSLTGPAYTATWTPSAAGTYTLTATAIDNSGAISTSAAITLTVTAAANQAPTVSLTAPVAGASLTVGQSVNLTASATDSDGTVASVSYYGGATLLGQSTVGPDFTVAWTPSATGSVSLTAKATDNSGAVTTSSAVSVTVAAQPVTEVNGRITDPILRFTALLRAFGATSANGNWLMNATDGADQLNQTPLRSQSVFNFVRPYYIPAGGEADTAKVTIPEMQITDEASVAGFINFMTTVVSNGHGSKGLDGSAANMDVQLDLTAETNVAADATVLADQVIAKLTPAGLPTATRQSVIDTLNTISAANANGKLRRARAAVLAVVAAQQFTVEAA